MPNWCNNTLSINGDKKTIQLIMRKLNGMNYNPDTEENLIIRRDELLKRVSHPMDADRIMMEYQLKIDIAKANVDKLKQNESGVFATLVGLPPKPEGFDETGYYTTNSYSDFYGTKWDINYDEWTWDVDDDEEWIGVNFETAWSPPTGFITKLATMYPGITDIQLDYSEGGCNFAGRMTIEKDASGGLMIDDDCLAYEEGLYKYDPDYFWSEVESNIEYAFENENDRDDILERYNFVSAEDKKQIEELIKTYSE